MSNNRLKIGIIGQGRSGRDIHGVQLSKMPDQYEIVAVADGMSDRRERAAREYDCRVYETYQAMAEREKLDLVVNASPSNHHFSITLDLLSKGINVLCEKPLAKSVQEVDRLIEEADQSGCLLAVFQQSRYLPAFVKMSKIIDSGILGRIVQIDITNNNFARRWDWQTLQRMNGGNLLNTGPHPVDQALHLFGFDIEPQITCVMDRANTFGDAEDYVKLLLRGEGRPTIDLEISSCSAFPRDKFIVQGTCGGLHGSNEKLEWKYFKPEEAPQQRLTDVPLIDQNGNPAFCSEKLVWYKDDWTRELPQGQSEFGFMTDQFYQMLHRTLTTGAPLEVTPQQVRRQMAVMEECRAQNRNIYQTV